MNHWISGSDYVDWLPLFSWGRETWRKRRDGRAPSIYHNIILMVFVQSARKRGVSSVSVRIPAKKENQLSACVCVCVKWCLLQEIGSCDCEGWQVPTFVLGKLETQESYYVIPVQRQGKERKKQNYVSAQDSETGENPPYLCHSDLQLIGWGPPALWKAISFPQTPLI